MKGFLYILQSNKNGRYYIGSTIDLERRLAEHEANKSTYTKLAGPFVLVFSQQYESIQEARRIEIKLKKLKSKKIIEQIVSDNFIKLGR